MLLAAEAIPAVQLIRVGRQNPALTHSFTHSYSPKHGVEMIYRPMLQNGVKLRSIVFCVDAMAFLIVFTRLCI